jgi:dihydrofolate reductase
MKTGGAKVGIVVALGKNGVHNTAIGKDGMLLWHIPDDLKRFKALTLGHPVIMGRKTFESIIQTLGKPLPGRTNIVVTRDPAWAYDNIAVFHGVESALEYAKTLDSEEVFIGGGGEIYKQALPFVDKLYLTLIEAEKEADSFFPEYEKEFTKKTFEEAHELDGLKYRFVNLERE